MKFLDFYKINLGLNNPDEVFEYLIQNLKPCNTTWSYFVDWEKVERNLSKYEVSLNTLNYLIGKDDFDLEFSSLIKMHPELIETIPLLAVRDAEKRKKYSILVDFKNRKLIYEDFNFSSKDLTPLDIERALVFVKGTGIKDLFTKKKIKNLVDYIFGVEAGLDSNGRKNRSGHAMESIVETFILDICGRHGFKYLREANAAKIFKEFGITVPVDKSSRRYDFVVNNGAELFLIETNFYGGGGSKLKSTAGEYRDLFNVLGGGFKFIWITDGLGWKTTSLPLRESFNQIDYLLNLKELENGVLENILGAVESQKVNSILNEKYALPHISPDLPSAG